MLTDEQRKRRMHGLGASEVPAVAGISPFASPIDIWLRKGTPERPPLVVDPEDPETGQGWLEVGDVLEPALLELYRRRTGFTATLTSRDTRQHPEHAWALATPDAITGPGHLVQLKVVGRWMVDHWDGGVPPYVVAQCAWELFVTGADRCDVAALINGTDFRCFQVDRSDELIKALFELARDFWHAHVLANQPPPASVDEDRRAYLAKRFPTHRDVILDVPENAAGFVSGLIEGYQEAVAAEHVAEQARRAAEAELCELVGEAAGIRSHWGQFTWKQQRGGIAYKAVAESLAPNGVLPADLLERHRSKSFRKIHYSPAKALTVRKETS